MSTSITLLLGHTMEILISEKMFTAVMTKFLKRFSWRENNNWLFLNSILLKSKNCSYKSKSRIYRANAFKNHTSKGAYFVMIFGAKSLAKIRFTPLLFYPRVETRGDRTRGDRTCGNRTFGFIKNKRSKFKCDGSGRF